MKFKITGSTVIGFKHGKKVKSMAINLAINDLNFTYLEDDIFFTKSRKELEEKIKILRNTPIGFFEIINDMYFKIKS